MDRWLRSGTQDGLTAFITLFFLYFCLFFSQPAMSIPAFPGVIQEMQPDGSEIQLHNRGYVTTTPNDGVYTDNAGQKGGGSHTHQVCEVRTNICSDAVNTAF